MLTAEKLAIHREKLDLTKRLSYGVQNSATNLIDERAKADKLSWEIANGTSEAKYLVISSLFNNARNNTIFDTVSEMLEACVPGVDASNVWAFKEGLIATEAGTGGTLKAVSKTPGRKINHFLNYLNTVPTRITKMRLKSVNRDNTPDLGNYDNEIKTIFFSPLAQPVEEQLSLSALVKTNNNFSPNILDVDFVDEAFEMILSNEHFVVIQINSNTVLNMTVSVGAQDSAPQRHWRTLKDADNILRGSK